MIKLIVNGSEVVLNQDVKIRLEYNSPLFDENIPGSKTFWFDIPKTPQNQKIFGFPEIPSISGKYRVYNNTSLYVASYKFLHGQIILKKIKNKYRAALTTNVFGNTYGEKKLEEIDFGADVQMGNNTSEIIDSANSHITNDYPDVNINFPIIYNPSFYGEDQPGHIGYINFYAYWESSFPRNRTHYLYYRAPVGKYHPERESHNNMFSLVPQIYLRYVLEKMLDDTGYTGYGDFFTDTSFQQLMLYCNYALDRLDPEYYVNAKSPSKNVDSNLIKWHWFEVGDHFTFDGSQFTVDHGDETIFDISLDLSWTDHSGGVTIQIKDVTADEVLYEHSESDVSDTPTIEFSYTHNFNERSDIGNAIEIQLVETDWNVDEGEYKIRHHKHNTLNRFAKSFNIQEIVPKVTFSKLLQKLRKLMHMALYFDDFSKQLEFFFLKDIEHTDYHDITELIDPSTLELELDESKKYVISPKNQDTEETDHYEIEGSYLNYENLPSSYGKSKLAVVIAQNNYYQIGENPEYNHTEWREFSKLDETVVYGEGYEESIEIKAKPAKNTNLPEVYSQTPAVIIPEIDSRGRSTVYKSKNKSEDQLYFFWWHGMANAPNVPYDDTIDSKYPFASSGKFDSEGNTVKDFALFFNGDDGLFENYMRSWYQIKQKLREKYKVHLHAGASIKDVIKLIRTISLPQNEDISEKKRWIIFENNKYLPEKMDVEISMKGIETVKLEMRKKAY